MKRALALYGLITLAFAWPVVTQLKTVVPLDAGDPLLNAWLLWWGSQRLPLTSAWWNAPMFYPMQSVMALSELLIGILPLSAPVQWATGSPQAAYNVAWLLSFPLCGAGAFALAREVTGRRDVSIVAGVAFMLAPYRMGQLGHLQMLAYYGAPAALAGLHRHLTTRSYTSLGVFGLAWLVQALSNGYAVFHVGLLIAAWLVWFTRTRREALPIVIAWGVSSLPLVPVLATYWQVHRELRLVRGYSEIRMFSADVSDWLSAAEPLWLWGRPLPPLRVEMALFPGLTIVGAAVVAAAWWWRSRDRRQPQPADARALSRIALVAVAAGLLLTQAGPFPLGPLGTITTSTALTVAVFARALATLRGPTLRRAWQERSPVGFYLVAVIGAYVLALGPEWRLSGHPLVFQTPYAWLLHVPGFNGLRVPARFAMIAVLGQSVLLAILLTRLKSSRRAYWLGLVALAVMAEGWIRLPVVPLTPGPRLALQNVDAVLELPMGTLLDDCAALSRAPGYGLPLANGYSGYKPAYYSRWAGNINAGRYEVLHNLLPQGTLAVAVRPDAPGAAGMVEALTRVPGIDRQSDTDGWPIFLVRPMAASQ